jgi:hypothetical protein
VPVWPNGVGLQATDPKDALSADLVVIGTVQTGSLIAKGPRGTGPLRHTPF